MNMKIKNHTFKFRVGDSEEKGGCTFIGGEWKDVTTDELFKGKKVVLFSLPGAFTPTCSEKHLPGFVKLYDRIKNCNIDDIYCLSVNDTFVMKAWLLRYNDKSKIKGIADGNGDISKSLNLLVDNSKNFMGMRCIRFALIAINNKIEKLFIEKPGEFIQSSAENIFTQL